MILLFLLCLAGLATALSVTDVPSCAVSLYAVADFPANRLKDTMPDANARFGKCHEYRHKGNV